MLEGNALGPMIFHLKKFCAYRKTSERGFLGESLELKKQHTTMGFAL